MRGTACPDLGIARGPGLCPLQPKGLDLEAPLRPPRPASPYRGTDARPRAAPRCASPRRRVPAPGSPARPLLWSQVRPGPSCGTSGMFWLPGLMTLRSGSVLAMRGPQQVPASVSPSPSGWTVSRAEAADGRLDPTLQVGEWAVGGLQTPGGRYRWVVGDTAGLGVPRAGEEATPAHHCASVSLAARNSGSAGRTHPPHVGSASSPSPGSGGPKALAGSERPKAPGAPSGK